MFFMEYLLFLGNIDFLVNYFVPALNLYQRIEASSSGMVLYTPLSNPDDFTLAA